MSKSSFTRLIACALALTLPLASAQNYQETQRQYDEQRRRMQEEREDARRREEARRNEEVMDDSLKRSHERNQQRDAGGSQGSGGNLDLMGAVVTLGVLASLAEMFLQPRAPRQVQAPSPEQLELAMRRQRAAFVMHQCVQVRRTELQPPRYDAPSSWALVRLFQPDPRKAYLEAVQRHQDATRETGPVCSCLSQRAVSAQGFAEAEWQAMAQRARSRDARPWLALEASRVKEVFEACAVQSPSDAGLTWLFPKAAP